MQCREPVVWLLVLYRLIESIGGTAPESPNQVPLQNMGNLVDRAERNGLLVCQCTIHTQERIHTNPENG